MPSVRKNIFEVAQRMRRSFYEAMFGPWSKPLRSVDEWHGDCGMGAEGYKVVARIVTSSAGNGAPREQVGDVVLSATAPIWLPGIPARKVFDYLCDGNHRGEWDNLANGAPILQDGHFATGLLPGNAVSVLRTIVSSVCYYSASFFSYFSFNQLSLPKS
jgi:homeobox-leucine zipper protein